MGRESNNSGKRRRAQHGPTVADVARLAGVSAMTVSRVVNAEGGVSDVMRARVREAIATLGYVPNQAARSLAGGRQCRIALLHSNPSAAYLSEFIVGALAEASEHDAQLVVEHCDDGIDAPALAARLVQHRIDACLLPPPLCDDAGLLTALAEARLPVAQVATGHALPEACAVRIDDAGAACAMTARLISAGHSRIGFIAGNANQSASALRRAGYEQALGHAGIVLDPALIASGDFTYRSGLAAAEQLLGLAVPPSAIFASNDDMAAAVMACAHRRGLDVPRDLAICGFDDTALATTVWPELTTIRQPIASMARRAVALLVEELRGGTNPAARHEELAFTLIARESDAAPAPLRV